MNEHKEIEVSENTTITYVSAEAMDVAIKNEPTSVYSEQLTTDIDVSDENIIDIEISEAFPFSTDGILDETLQDKDVLINSGIVDDINAEAISMQEVLEACAALGGAENVSHGTLYGTEQPNQHPISAITDLEEELERLNALKTVYSNGKGFAQYYRWQEVPTNSFGYFVTKLSDNTIKIIDSKDEDVFGVITDAAGFISGQDTPSRGNDYGLVVYAGEAIVRCESNVKIGDYVTTNDGGEAKKAEGGYGYRVTEVQEIHQNQIYCAKITLNISANQINSLGADVDSLSVRMNSAERNVTSAINVANKAYNLASGLGDIGSLNASTVEKADEALDKAETALDTAEGLNSQIQSAMTTATQAKTIANNAVTSAETIKAEAVDTANKALSEAANAVSEIDALKEEMTPLAEWSDENGNSGYAGFIARADADSAILADMVQWQGEVEAGTIESIASISKKADENESKISALTTFETNANAAIGELQVKSDENGAYIQGLVCNINKYTYGEYSQAYGLTQEQAEEILKVGIVYVPNVDHSEIYGESEGYEAVEYTFSRGYYYTWNGTNWVGSVANAVAFSSEYVIGNENAPYWATTADVSEGDISYKNNTLYKWQDNAWLEVATLESNISNRITSLVKQAANSIESAITTVNGNYAGTKAWVDDNKAAIQDVVSWHGENGDSLVTFMQEAGDNFASASQIAQVTDKDGNVTSASIMAIVEDNISTVNISADQIIMDGATTFLTPEDVGENGTTTIYGGRIATGSIESTGYKDENATVFADAGTRFNLDDGSIRAKNFAVTADGDLYAKNAWVSGIITATSGSFTDCNIKKGCTIAGFTIDDTSIRHTKTAYNESTNDGVYLGTDGIGLGKGAFYVDNTGYLHATNAYIDGEIHAGAGDIANWYIDENFIISNPYMVDGALNDGVNISGLCSTDGMEQVGDYYINYEHESLTAPGAVSPIRFLAGWNPSHDNNFVNISDNANFMVLEDGSLYANAASITGDITATSGDIGGWTIDSEIIFSETSSLALPRNTLCGMYNGNDITMPSLVSEEENATSPIRFFAGTLTESGLDNGEWINSPFMVLDDGSLYANAAKIDGDSQIGNYTIEDGNLTCSYGEISGGKWSAISMFLSMTDSSTKDTYATKVSPGGIGIQTNYDANDSKYPNALETLLIDSGSLWFNNQYASVIAQIKLTEDVFYIDCGQGTGQLVGTWYCNSAQINASDRNVKYDIQDTPDTYEVLFDNLQSKIFKYNDGASDRYHTGFEAQGVDEAVQKAGLTRKDFAAVCIANEGTEKEHWGLRYDEFVSLNTWQIQKAKSRITALEDKVVALEERIAQLEK